MNESVVNKALDEARSFLSNEVAWIKDSSLHLRAFYLGLYVGLGQLGSDTGRERVLGIMYRETMWAKAGDDSFGASALGAKLRDSRERLLHSLDSSHGKQSSIDSDDVMSLRKLALCIEQLDQRWRLHYDLVQRELGGTQSDAVSPQKALEVLKIVDSSFRELLRVLTEKPDASDGS
jgi:hypothetical protein